MQRDSRTTTEIHRLIMESLPENITKTLLTVDKVVQRIKDYMKDHVYEGASITSFRKISRYHFGTDEDLDSLGYMALLPDGTEEYLLALFWTSDHFPVLPRIKVSWEEIKDLEAASRYATVLSCMGKETCSMTKDELKAKRPELLEIFNALYESWRVTYRCGSAFKEVLEEMS